MTSRRSTETVDNLRDRGAALILAIGFVLMISAIAGGLAALIATSFENRSSLEGLRNRQYAADAAIQDAITQVRTVTDRSLPVTCAGFTTNLNSVTIRVDCAKAYGIAPGTDNLVLSQRNVIFNACLDTGSACTDASTIIRAQVSFEQLYAGAVTTTFVQSWSVNR